MSSVVRIRGISSGDPVTRPSDNGMFFHDVAPMDGVMISVKEGNEIYLSRDVLDAIMSVFVSVEQGRDRVEEISQWGD